MEADNMTKEGQVPINYKNSPFPPFSRGKKKTNECLQNMPPHQLGEVSSD